MAETASGSGPDSLAGFTLLGLHHGSVPPAVRDRLFIESPDPAPLLARLRGLEVENALVLATCERLEILLARAEVGAKVGGGGEGADETAAIRLLLAQAGAGKIVSEAELKTGLRVLRGPAALRHLFATAAALESRVPGEPEILGQVKAAHRAAHAAGLVGPALERALQGAYIAAKRVRQETALAAHPVSIAAAALKTARDVHGDPRRLSALLLGLGEMSELMAAQLREAGIARLTVAHPVARRAAAAAERWSAAQRDWGDLETTVAEADIVVAALGRGGYTLDAAMLRRVFKRRRQRPIFILDAAVPADVDPSVEDLESAFVYTLDDLERIAAEGLARRETAARDAWRIVDQELDAFRRRGDAQAAGAAIGDLRAHGEALRAAVLAEAPPDADTATRRLLARLLHTPSEALRAAAAHDPAVHAELERALRRLFGLDQTPTDAASGPDSNRDRNESGAARQPVRKEEP